MGCQCCRMIKSYIYDPSVAVDGRKSDPAGSSLYQPHYLSGGPPGGDPRHNKHKQGIQNPGFSKSNDSTLKLEVDNNHVNYRLHSVPSKEVHRQASAPPAEGALYIIQPDAPGPRWIMQDREPSQVPVYPEIQNYGNQRDYNEQVRNGWSGSEFRTTCESLSADEIDEGVGGTPEYPCDTGDEGSALSVDIQTSTTSLSSVDTKEDRRTPKTPTLSTVESGILVTKSEDEEDDEPGREAVEVASVTDSMVAEALAALEAATAGEEFE